MDLRIVGDSPGWLEWRDAPDGLQVRVRLKSAADGRLEPDELRIESATCLSSDQLRVVPLGRIEANANGPALRPLLLASLATDRPSEPVEFHEVRPKAKAAGRSKVASPRTSFAGHAAAHDADKFHSRPLRSSDLKIDLGDDRKRSDEFYAKVADVYSRLAGTSRRPAADIAAANDVPVTTAHRWIKECRRRGLLPPGRRGQAG